MTRQNRKQTRKKTNEAMTSGLINLNFGSKITDQEYQYPVIAKMTTKPTPQGYSGPLRSNPYKLQTRSDAVALVDLCKPMTNGTTTAFEQMISVLMSKLRAVSTSVVTYTPKDLQAYVLNVRSIVAEIVFLQRFIASLRSFNPYDASSPKSIQEVCFPGQTFPSGVNVGDTLNRLQTMLARVSSLLPTVTPFTYKAAGMFSFVLRDSPRAKYAMKAYVLARANRFMVNQEGHVVIDTPHVIEHYDGNGKALDVLNLLDSLESWINAMSVDPIVINITADIYKAFGTKSMLSIPTVDPNSMVIPIYNESLLTAWENQTLLPNAAAEEKHPAFSVSYLPTYNEDEAKVLLCTTDYVETSGNMNEVLVYGMEGYMYKRINVDSDAPTAGDTLSALQHASIFDIQASIAHATTAPDSPGSYIVDVYVHTTPGELVCGYYYRDGKEWIPANPRLQTRETQQTIVVTFTVATTPASTFKIPALWSMNDWEPAITTMNDLVLYDLKNFAVVDNQALGTFIDWVITGSNVSPTYVQKQENFRF